MSAAATAAGYLYASGRLRRSQPEPSSQAAQRAMRLCSVCRERVPVESHEFHMLIAHHQEA